MCIKNKDLLLSDIDKNGKVNLTEIGKIIEAEWLKTETVRENVKLGGYVIMPDHFHGVIIITKKNISDNIEKPIVQFRKLIAGSIGSMINQVKSKSTKRIIKAGYTEFKWQQNYFDRIIYTKEEKEIIENYIKLNPIKWIEKKKSSD